MSNFTDFFPAASGGGGGFTKQLKWTTARGLDDANYNDAASYTVNPATDLGLSDGDSLGYFMVSSGCGSTNTPGNGGYILQGTSIISNASTNLVLTPASAATSGTSRVHSTISGGLTLTTADSYNSAGASDGYDGNPQLGFSYGNGIMGYGAGGKWADGVLANDFPRGDQSHGFGNGGAFFNSNFLTGSDGAILLFY